MHEHHHTDRTAVVVVGASGSPASRASVHRAALSVRATGGVLHLVHAYDPRPRFQHDFDRRRAPADVAFAVCPRGEAEELLVDEARRIAGLGVHVVFHAVPGVAADVLRDLAEELGADVVVVGSAKARPRRFGVSARLERDCSCELRVVSVGEQQTRDLVVAPAWRSARV